jgi:hypothetical protein
VRKLELSKEELEGAEKNWLEVIEKPWIEEEEETERMRKRERDKERKIYRCRVPEGFSNVFKMQLMQPQCSHLGNFPGETSWLEPANQSRILSGRPWYQPIRAGCLLNNTLRWLGRGDDRSEQDVCSEVSYESQLIRDGGRY